MNLVEAVSFIEGWFKTFDNDQEAKTKLKKAFIEFIEEC